MIVNEVPEKLQVEFSTRRIHDLVDLWESGRLNLSPGFQRQSVWKDTDRRLLVQSIFEGYPVPSIFLYKRIDGDGAVVYDVVDGKQRIETILKYCRARRFGHDGFPMRFRFNGDKEVHWVDWSEIKRRKLMHVFEEYQLPIVEVEGDLADIVHLFVRINSTGKALTGQERRNANYLNSPLLKEANGLAAKWRAFLLSSKVVSKTNVERMRDVELACELLTSILAGGPVQKKQAIDKAVGNEAFRAPSLRKAKREFNSGMSWIRRYFPTIRETRFHGASEFYTLFMLLWRFRHERLVLGDARRNRTVVKLLTCFSTSVDEVRAKREKIKGAKPGEEVYVQYLLATQEGTDTVRNRVGRERILEQVVRSVLESKDDRRRFSPEQRRLLWNSDDNHVCRMCGAKLDWTNYQVDHIKPHARGGKTDIANGQLLCAGCNRRKGAKPARRARRA